MQLLIKIRTILKERSKPKKKLLRKQKKNRMQLFRKLLKRLNLHPKTT